jgi:hypothetical protein
MARPQALAGLLLIIIMAPQAQAQESPARYGEGHKLCDLEGGERFAPIPPMEGAPRTGARGPAFLALLLVFNVLPVLGHTGFAEPLRITWLGSPEPSFFVSWLIL